MNRVQIIGVRAHCHIGRFEINSTEMYTPHPKFFTLLSILTVMCHCADAQFALYQSNPLGAISKARLKVEYRFESRHAVLAAGTVYYGYCPGSQLFGEYRYYAKRKGHSELFYYGKAGYGSSKETAFNRKSYGTGVFEYALAGGGVGLHVRMGMKQRFLFDLAGGIKSFTILTPTTKFSDLEIFYITGPGSIVDINAHFGLRLSSK